MSLESNSFYDFRFLDDLIDFPIVHFRNKLNPLSEVFTKDYVFQRTIAQLSTMKTLNGVTISRYERKDYEIFYLR